MIDKWLWFASSLNIHLISAITDYCQLFQSNRPGCVLTFYWIFDNFCVLICSDDTFNADGINPITISRVIPQLGFALVDFIPVFGKWDIAYHAYYCLYSGLRDFLLWEQFASIVVFAMSSEVLLIVSIVQQTCQNNVLLLSGANIINSIYCLHTMAHNDKSVTDSMSVVYTIFIEDLWQFLDAWLKSFWVTFDGVHFDDFLNIMRLIWITLIQIVHIFIWCFSIITNKIK